MTPQRRKSKCSKLMVDWRIVNQPEAQMEVWAQHLGKLAKLKVNKSDGVQDLSCKRDMLASRSVSNEEFVLDVPFSVDEVITAVRKLSNFAVSMFQSCRLEHNYKLSTMFKIVHYPIVFPPSIFVPRQSRAGSNACLQSFAHKLFLALFRS